MDDLRPSDSLSVNDRFKPREGLSKDTFVMGVARDRELKSLYLYLPDLNFPCEDEPGQLHAIEEVSEAHHALPFELLLFAMLKPFPEDAGD